MEQFPKRKIDINRDRILLIPIFVLAEENNEGDNSLGLADNAKSAIMIEASTGKVIYEKNVPFLVVFQKIYY